MAGIRGLPISMKGRERGKRKRGRESGRGKGGKGEKERGGERERVSSLISIF